MSKLTQDLNSVAGIVGALGLSIADAQREMNRDYLEALERLVAVAASLTHKDKKKKADGTGEALTAADREFIKEFLSKFAPTRYQYTRTELSVRMDLAQTKSIAGSAGVGGSIGAVAVNASLALAYGSEYQAAAECRTVIDAISPTDDLAFFQRLSEQATKVGASPLPMPARAEVDEKTIATAESIIDRLLGIKADKAPAGGS